MSTKSKRVGSKGAVFFTILALIFTVITAWLLSMMFSGSKYAQEDMVKVVVANRSFEPFEPLNRQDFREVTVPASSLPAGSYASVDALIPNPDEPPKSVVRLYKDEIVLGTRLADYDSGWGMASRIPYDDDSAYAGTPLRAIAVRVDSSLTVSRLVYPGAIVDVLATLRMPKRDITATQIIIQGVEVLAVDANVDAAQMTAKEIARASAVEQQSQAPEVVVALLVTPEQAEQLTMATREGRIDLVLRNSKDQRYYRTTGVQPEDLFPQLSTEKAKQQRVERRPMEELERSTPPGGSRAVVGHPRLRKPVVDREPTITIQ